MPIYDAPENIRRNTDCLQIPPCHWVFAILDPKKSAVGIESGLYKTKVAASEIKAQPPKQYGNTQRGLRNRKLCHLSLIDGQSDSGTYSRQQKVGVFVVSNAVLFVDF